MSAIPLTHHFDDMGVVVHRTSWDLQIGLQGDRIVVSRLPRGIEQRDRPFRNEVLQRLQSLGMRIEFLSITRAELVPEFRLVMEHGAQLIAWRDIAKPSGEIGGITADTAGP